MAVGGEEQPIAMKTKQLEQENNERRIHACMLLFGKNTFIIYYSNIYIYLL